MKLKEFFLGKPWGQELQLEITNCNPKAIRSKTIIKKWLKELPKTIDMNTFGEPLTERFALHNPQVAGYSGFIFLETSNLSAHFSEESNTVFINVFSCKEFDPKIAIATSIRFFGDQNSYYSYKNVTRRIPSTWKKIKANIWKSFILIVNFVNIMMEKFPKSN